MPGDIVSPPNLNDAYRRVRANRGGGGVDGMTVEGLLPYLKTHGGKLVDDLLHGKYRPSPVRRVEIPKDNGKKRQPGIPTVVDRMVQQAVAQVLTPIYEAEFAETSYGFRPGRSAHDALRKCREYLDAGYVWTVDMDLEKFFDTVNRSKLPEVLSRRVRDGRVVPPISRFLRAGAVRGGRFGDTEVGVPQGGPLSPLCANIMLNGPGRGLERGGHRFVRYADDIVIFCRSKASAGQTLRHIIPFIEKKLFLKVNREKTVVAYAGKIKFPGYGFYRDGKGFHLRVHPRSITKMQAKVGEATDRRRLMPVKQWVQAQNRFVTGWVNYFKLAGMDGIMRDTDGWMRRRIRMVFLKRWKKGRAKFQNLTRLGLNEDGAKKAAYSRKGYWRTALCGQMHTALSKDRLQRIGFASLRTYYRSVHCV